MLADPSTKGMKHEGLKRLMDGFEVDMTPSLDGLRTKKDYGCEISEVDPRGTTSQPVGPSIRPAGSSFAQA